MAFTIKDGCVGLLGLKLPTEGVLDRRLIVVPDGLRPNFSW